MIKKKLILIVSCVLLLVAVSSVIIITRGSRIAKDSLYIKNVGILNNVVNISGDCARGSSAECFSGYSYSVKGRDLFLTIRNSVFVLPSQTRSSNFDIEIKAENISNIFVNCSDGVMQIYPY